MSRSTEFEVLIAGATAGDRIGCSIAALGDWAVVGACAASSEGQQAAGVVHAFSVSTRSTSSVLVHPPIAVGGARFGTSLAMAPTPSDSTHGLLVVGSIGEQYERGSAYVFQFPVSSASDTFSYDLLLQLSAQDGRVEDHFGSAVAISGRRAVIGAKGPFHYPAGQATIDGGGAVYVFDVLTGMQLAKLQPVDPATRVPLLGCYWFGAAVALADGVLLVGAPRAKAPCAPGVLAGAAFAFTAPPYSGGPLLPPGYNQTARLIPAESSDGTDTAGGQFGTALAVTTTATWRPWAPPSSVLVVGSPGAAEGRGALYAIGPFDSTTTDHGALHAPNAWLPRYVAPAWLHTAGLGASLSVDSASGLVAIGAPDAFTRHGSSGAVLRSWALHRMLGANQSGGAGGYVSEAPPSPPPLTSLPLSGVHEGFLWGPEAEVGDAFGTTVALLSSGYVVAGAPQRASVDANATRQLLSGAAYSYEPSIITLSASPPAQPPNSPRPLPPPLAPPPGPPPFPDTRVAVMVTVGAISGAMVGLLLVALLARRVYLAYHPQVLPRRQASWTADSAAASAQRRKLIAAIRLDPKSELNVAEQFERIIASSGLRMVDVFRSLDDDGSGSVSRKEFRRGVAALGYTAPLATLNAAFEAFDINGSGEIDFDEFQTTINAKKKGAPAQPITPHAGAAAATGRAAPPAKARRSWGLRGPTRGGAAQPPPQPPTAVAAISPPLASRSGEILHLEEVLDDAAGDGLDGVVTPVAARVTSKGHADAAGAVACAAGSGRLGLMIMPPPAAGVRAPPTHTLAAARTPVPGMPMGAGPMKQALTPQQLQVKEEIEALQRSLEMKEGRLRTIRDANTKIKAAAAFAAVGSDGPSRQNQGDAVPPSLGFG